MVRIAFAALVMACVLASPALAQSTDPLVSAKSDLMLSWRSNALSPAGYAGRVPASEGGSVLFLVEALRDGRPASLAAADVRWYVDGELYQSGAGLYSVTYRVPQFSPSKVNVRVEIVGSDLSANEASMDVPFGRPDIVIEAPRGNFLYPGMNSFVATPYGFNVAGANSLLYTWYVDGNLPEQNENPRNLDIDVQGQLDQQVEVTVTALNTKNPGEEVGKAITLNPAP